MVACRGKCPVQSPPRPGPRSRPGPARPGTRRGVAGRAVLASAFAELRAALRHRGLAVRRLVLVNDALASGLVQVLRRGAHRHGRRLHIAGVSGLAELAHRGLQRRLDSLVALPCLLVLLIALDLGLDIRHAEASLRFWFSSVGAGGFRTRGSPTNSKAGRNTPRRKDIPTPGPRSNQAARPRRRGRSGGATGRPQVGPGRDSGKRDGRRDRRFLVWSAATAAGDDGADSYLQGIARVRALPLHLRVGFRDGGER